MIRSETHQKATEALFVIECESNRWTKEELLRFTIVSFSGKLIFNGVHGALAR